MIVGYEGLKKNSFCTRSITNNRYQNATTISQKDNDMFFLEVLRGIFVSEANFQKNKFLASYHQIDCSEKKYIINKNSK